MKKTTHNQSPRSKHKQASSLIRQFQKHAFDNGLTISGLCKQAGIPRQTYYQALQRGHIGQLLTFKLEHFLASVNGGAFPKFVSVVDKPASDLSAS